MEQEERYQEPEIHDSSPYPILFIFTACTIGGKLQVLAACVVTLPLNWFISWIVKLELIAFLAFLFQLLFGN